MFYYRTSSETVNNSEAGVGFLENGQRVVIFTSKLQKRRTATTQENHGNQRETAEYAF